MSRVIPPPAQGRTMRREEDDHAVAMLYEKSMNKNFFRLPNFSQ
jgi:hypothetical protein